MKDFEYKLYFYQNNKLLKKVGFRKGENHSIIVGSGSKADITIKNSRISREHLQIIFQSDGRLFSQDLKSTNGTYLNGLRLNEGKVLTHKDKLQLAGTNDIIIFIEKPVRIDTEKENEKIINLLRTKNTVTIGRDPSCDVVINHRTVSKTHASISVNSKNNYVLKDLNSTNGTYVNGLKIIGQNEIDLKDKIFIGRHEISLGEKVKKIEDELAITAIGIEKTYPNGVKGLKKMDLSIPSKSLISIMGPSGCGKSTLLKALNGDTPPSKGKIFLFNLELTKNWQYLKTQIGYVPQDDIIHRQLTVNQCLYYTAKLRLNNISDNDIDEKINQVLSDLNILDKKNSLINNLSGGQRKRVSIAVELMTDPLIMFLDEPTSPLDPQTIEDFLNIIKNLSEKGTTVIMVTHKPEDLEYMDEVIFLAEGGNIVYHGNAKNYKEYFNVKSVVSVFSEISGKKAEVWINKFLKPISINKNISYELKKSRSETSSFNQLYWLSKRYFRIKINDNLNSILLLAQAPIIAILICLVFDQFSSSVLFMIAISSIWLGAQNSAREIVSETPIYRRERMFNLKILPYVFSKISVLSFFSLIQSTIFIFILLVNFNTNDSLVSLYNPLKIFSWMVFLSISSCFLGLLLSSIVKTTERAMTILPLILLPQIMLAGVISKINNFGVELISYMTLSRWGVEGFHIIQKNITATLADVPIKVDSINLLNANFHSSYVDKSLFGSLTSTLTLDFYVISFMVILMTIIIFNIIKSRDSHTIN